MLVKTFSFFFCWYSKIEYFIEAWSKPNKICSSEARILEIFASQIFALVLISRSCQVCTKDVGQQYGVRTCDLYWVGKERKQIKGDRGSLRRLLTKYSEKKMSKKKTNLFFSLCNYFVGAHPEPTKWPNFPNPYFSISEWFGSHETVLFLVAIIQSKLIIHAYLQHKAQDSPTPRIIP